LFNLAVRSLSQTVGDVMSDDGQGGEVVNGSSSSEDVDEKNNNL